MSNGSTVCQFKSAARSDKILADYLKVILEEVRTLRMELKKLDTEIKDLKKQITTHNHQPPSVKLPAV